MAAGIAFVESTFPFRNPLESSASNTVVAKDGLPGLDWVRRNVPILSVAMQLGLEVVGNSAHCWRKNSHNNGDANPTLGFDIPRNRYKCFRCDARSSSVVDLVMAVLGISLRKALEWLGQRFPIPTEILQTSQPPYDPNVWRRVSLETIVKSGVWANLSRPRKAILVTLWTNRDSDTGLVRMSYERILRLSGLGSRKTVADTIRYFEQIGLLAIERRDRCMNRYMFIDTSDFRDLQRTSLEELAANAQRVVPIETARFGNRQNRPSPSVRNSPADQKLVPSERTSSPSPPPIGLSSPIRKPDFRMVEIEAAILRLASRGWLIFPCKAGTKQPAVSNWRRLATRDPARIVRWLGDFPECNWAIATGPASGLFVLDVDGEEGFASYLSLCQSYGEIETLGVKTSRGSHLYFRYPATGVVRNSAARVGRGLDVRGVGGYVLTPPSIHPDGVAYEWLGGVEDRPIASAPPWLLRAIEEEDIYGTNSPETFDYEREERFAIEHEELAREAETTFSFG